MLSHGNVIGVGIHQQLFSKWIFNYLVISVGPGGDLEISHSRTQTARSWRKQLGVSFIAKLSVLDSKLAYVCTRKLVDPHSNHCHQPKD